MLESAIRKGLVDFVRSELLGPHDPGQLSEVLEGVPPHRRYVVGQLLPRGPAGDELRSESALPELEESALEIDGDESDGQGPADVTIERRTAVSSMGLSFVVKTGAQLVVDVEWGEYDEERNERDRRWRRRHQSMTVELTRISTGKLREDKVLSPRALLSAVGRPESDLIVVSLFLVNTTKKGGATDERFYQPKLRVRGKLKTDQPFVSRDRLQRDLLDDDEDAADNALLYRNRKEFAVGRHVAVTAFGEDAEKGTAAVLETEVIPAYELPTTEARSSLGGGGSDILDMRTLAEATSATELADKLTHAFAEYGAWIEVQRGRLGSFQGKFNETASRRLANCDERLNRIRAGIDSIRDDDDVAKCFVAANEAMARVRFRQPLVQGEVERDDSRFDPTGRDGRWYPFQLAFLLSIIPDLAYPEDEAKGKFRRAVDILFFPTGGGKTEAYLGAIAFSALLRRRRGCGAGVSSVLRYTYRLLSSQQFSRVATLICALESMRLEANAQSGARVSWLQGSDAFSAGLWIGRDHSPNNHDKAAESVTYYRSLHDECTRKDCKVVAERVKGQKTEQPARRASDDANLSSPLVIPQCPWCGGDLCIGCVWTNNITRRTSIVCSDTRCLFYAVDGEQEDSFARRIGLPILTVDEEIFHSCPTVIVGTADKFATMWYRPEARMLFGKVSAYCDSHGFLSPLDKTHSHVRRPKPQAMNGLAPIDLYVQDELHLINEALGSAYGLVECAVDALSAALDVQPKKIGATATIRRAKSQVKSLFARDAVVFPIAPIDAGDSFFAKEVEPSERAPGRLYVGIYAPSQSRLYALDQAIAAALDAAHRLAQSEGDVILDPYLTLVLYFNTLRDLGQVQGLLVDDVPKHLTMLAAFRGETPRVLYNVKQELTSKTPQPEVRETERKLRSTFVDEGRQGRRGCDAVCATSMLSVGIDIPRLGAMLVDGQPKSTAEYIQATSRVGRKKPGIVLTVYNANRPRDLSHYEHFHAYHASLYRFVESPSVTPTSFGTIDKYLANVFIALYRLQFGFRAGDEPVPFVEHQAAVRAAFNAVLDRVIQIAASEEEVSHATACLAKLVDKWHAAAVAGPPLKYVLPWQSFNRRQEAKIKESVYVARIDDPTQAPENVLFKVPMSLRNVEPELRLVVVR